MDRVSMPVLLCVLILSGAGLAQTPAQRPPTYPGLLSETPTSFDVRSDTFDYVKRDVMIPMRDGVMVQVQSSWFPLYDRNPQAFVPNIFWAKPADYHKAVQRIYHEPDQASFVELPLVTTP
jgi:predicted acyl esterase